MSRNGQIPGLLHRLHCPENSFTACIALRRTGHISNRLGQNNLCLRHTDPLHCQRSIRCHCQSIRVCISHILRRTYHNPSGNKSHTLPCIEHSCQIINRRVRVRSPHTFDKCGYGIVMAVTGFIIPYRPLLNTFLCYIQCNINPAILTPSGGHNA